jgi:hypothetical protein
VTGVLGICTERAVLTLSTDLRTSSVSAAEAVTNASFAKMVVVVAYKKSAQDLQKVTMALSWFTTKVTASQELKTVMVRSTGTM